MTGTGPPGSRPDEGGGGSGADDAAWLAEGITADEAAIFRRWRISLAQAVAWRQAGVPDGLRAAQWTTAAVTPDSVSNWRAAGIDASQAVHWHEMGFGLAEAREAVRRGLTPDDAFARRHPSPLAGSGGAQLMHRGFHGGRAEVVRKLQQAGVPPRVLQGYLQGTWEIEEALPWARAGVEAADAVLWRALGLTAVEAGRLAAKGASAVATVCDWWRAGIPFDEAADWIGAGLSPQEAAEQRAKGITAEQAAALRALRNQDLGD
jgi:hypothetical protein